MKYSIEQIEAAISNSILGEFKVQPEFLERVVAELTLPVWKPEVGEVYFTESGHYTINGKISPPNIAKLPRPLTSDEVPALKVAIEALKIALADIIDYGADAWPTGPQQRVNDALAKIKELTNA